MINIKSTLLTLPDLCQNVYSHYYFVATVIQIQSLRSQICVYIHIIPNIFEAAQAKEIKILHSSDYHVQRKFFLVLFWARVP
jgi:hypothetical protein